jgi:hypothetical protein
VDWFAAVWLFVLEGWFVDCADWVPSFIDLLLPAWVWLVSVVVWVVPAVV